MDDGSKINIEEKHFSDIQKADEETKTNEGNSSKE
jgi:hypothetical protein